jgi:hypothetical protein
MKHALANFDSEMMTAPLALFGRRGFFLRFSVALYQKHCEFAWLAVAEISSKWFDPLSQIKPSKFRPTSILGMTRDFWLFCLSLAWLALVAGAIGFVLGHYW